MKPVPPERMRAVRARHVRMRADDEADAAVDEIAEGLFFARRFGVEIEDRRVAADPERARLELLLDALEGVVERVHEHAPHHVDDEHLGAVGGLEEIGAAPRRPLGIIGGADEARLALDEHQRLALIEGVVAERDRVDAGGEEFLADRLGDPEAAGGVLAVDDDEIEPPARTQNRDVGEKGGAPRTADDVADEEEAHQERLRAAIHSRSVRMKSSGSSCGSSGTAATSQTE